MPDPVDRLLEALGDRYRIEREIGSGEADGFLFYVMPYIEGETLRDKLNHKT